MSGFIRLQLLLGVIGWIATALTIWNPVYVPVMEKPFVFPFWPWSAVVLLVAAAGFLVKRPLRGPIRGRWQLWCFVTAVCFLIAGAVRIFLPAREFDLAAGPIVLAVALIALAVEEARLDI